MDDLVKGDDAIFAATGVTDGELLRVYAYMVGKRAGNPFCCNARAKTGTVRFIRAIHILSKKLDPSILPEPSRGEKGSSRTMFLLLFCNYVKLN